MENNLAASPLADSLVPLSGAGMQTVYVLGCGAIGLTLAAYLACEGRPVLAVRTSNDTTAKQRIIVTLRSGPGVVLKVPIETISLSQLAKLDGIVAVTAKSHANQTIAATLLDKGFAGPLVLMQNGMGVEQPFLALPFASLYRCVLYVTSQTTSENEVTFRQISSSPIGMVKGIESDLEGDVKTLSTPGFRFHPEQNIQRDIWRKTIINAVFNSICPLLEIDNGVFARDQEAVKLAREIVGECIVLAEAKGIGLTEAELMEQIMKISRGSDGQFISTLQDIRNGRQTEMEYLNLEVARIASAMNPKIDLRKTRLLGNMILAKSRDKMAKRNPAAAQPR